MKGARLDLEVEEEEESLGASRARWMGETWKARYGAGGGRDFLRTGVRDVCRRATQLNRLIETAM